MRIENWTIWFNNFVDFYEPVNWSFDILDKEIKSRFLFDSAAISSKQGIS